MKIRSLVWNEVIHRKLNFAIALLAVAVAVACSVGVVTLIRSYQLRTEARVAVLDDEIRKITKNMGFNITILPKDQNLADFHASDFAEKTMPYEFVRRLAESKDVVTIQHLRPALVRKMEWPEQNRQIVLMGVSGVVPFLHRDPKKPLSQPVPKGTMNLGNVLADQLQLRQGDPTALAGRTFRVGKVYPARGTKDDITVWIDLEEAQQLLDLEGRINMIQALECNCSTVDRLAEIQSEISGLLGNEVQVIELATKAIARAKARNQVQAEGVSTVVRLERLASILLPLAIVGAALLVGLLALANVRERRAEIGVLRAVGTRSRQILALFVSKAFIVGLGGAILGYALGFAGASGLTRYESDGGAVGSAVEPLFQPGVFVAVLLLAPTLAVLASWMPAMLAASQDPAAVLREE
jgi:ABC-type lipoprotein release transport system permease subunit